MALLYKNDPQKHARAVRALANLSTNTHRGVFDRALESGEPLILFFADGTQRKVTITAVQRKQFSTEDSEHAKLEVLYALEPKAAKAYKRVVRKDPQVAGLGAVPSPDPEKRLHLSKMLLQRLVDESLFARFTLVDGTVIPCRTRSFGFFELNGELKGGGAVVLMRHALHRISAGDEVLADIALGFHVQGRPPSDPA